MIGISFARYNDKEDIAALLHELHLSECSLDKRLDEYVGIERFRIFVTSLFDTGRAKIITAKKDGKPCGLLIFEIMEHSPEFIDKKFCYIHYFFVKDIPEKEELKEELMKHLKKYLKGRTEEIIMDIYPEDRELFSFLKKRGFSEKTIKMVHSSE